LEVASSPTFAVFLFRRHHLDKNNKAVVPVNRFFTVWYRPTHSESPEIRKEKKKKKIGKKFSHRASTVPTGTATFNSAGNSSGFAFRLLPSPSQQKNNNENTTSTKLNRSNFNRQLQPTNTYSTTIPTTTKRLQHDANDDQQQQNRDDDDRTIR
jgi:hypothetical protein